MTHTIELPEWGPADRLYWEKLIREPIFTKALYLIERATRPNGGELTKVAGVDYIQLSALAAARYEGRFDVFRWLETLHKYAPDAKPQHLPPPFEKTPRPSTQAENHGE